MDLEAEAAVISTAILKPTMLPIILATCKESEFYSDQNRTIMRAIAALDADGIPVDVVTLVGRLRETAKLGQAGGAGYIAQLLDATPAVANVKVHATIVREKARRRRVIAALQATTARSYGGTDEDAAQLVTELQATLDGETSGGTVDAMSSFDVALVEGLEEVARIHAQVAHGGVSGLSTGIEPLDLATGGLHPADTLFIGGPKGGGKTSLAGQLCFEATKHQTVDEDGNAYRCGAALFTLEMPREQLALRMACAYAGIELHALRNGTATHDEFTRMYGAAEELRGLPIVIDDTPGLTPAILGQRIRLARAQLAAKGAKLRLIVVDYIQLMEPDVAKGERDTEESVINDNGRRLRVISQREKDTTMVVLSQLNAKGELRGSRALEMHAVNVWSVHVDWKDASGPGGAKATRLQITKQRNAPACEVPLWFHAQHARFSGGV